MFESQKKVSKKSKLVSVAMLLAAVSVILSCCVWYEIEADE